MPNYEFKKVSTIFFPGTSLFNIYLKKLMFIVSTNTNIKSEMISFKSNENIHMKEGGSYYVVSANKASSVTL